MSSKVDRPQGNTPVTNFRLGGDVLAKLDELVGMLAAESGDIETRTSVVRKLINREHAKRKKGATKK